MSDNWITFVSTDMHWQPADLTIVEKISALAMSTFPEADEVTALTHDNIDFVNPVANLESISCPFCQSDLLEWWLKKMGDLNCDYSAIDFVVPCCAKPTSLNDLVFDFPAAYAKFQLDVMNPNIADVPNEFIQTIEAITGQTIKVVRTHI